MIAAPPAGVAPHMKVVYQITLYHKKDQFRWLMAALYNDLDYFLIHIDKNSPDSYVREIVEICGNRPNIHFQYPLPIYWGGWSIVESQLQGLQEAVERWPDWQYFLNISGQDYPLRRREGIIEYLTGLNGSSGIACMSLPDLGISIRRRTWFQCIEYGHRVHRLPLPRADLLVRRIKWKGSGWHILSRGFGEWVVSSPTAVKWRKLCRRVMFPDEFYFQNVIMDGPFQPLRSNDNGRFVLWEQASSRPTVLRRNDFERMMESGKIFARKFDNDQDIDIIRAIAEKVGHPTPE